MSYFLGFVKMMMMIFVFVFVVLVFQGSSATGKLDLSLDELSGREESVKWAGYGEEKLSTVVVNGKILCHGTGGVEEEVSGAMVAVFCGTRKKSWTKGSTDSYGNFLIDLPSHLHAIPNLEKICHVKIVHIPPTSPCRHEACARKQHKEIKLSSIGEGTRTYTTDNIHLMPIKHS